MSEREHLGHGRLERLRARARVLKAIRAYFDEEGFLEVETPSRVPSPGMDLHLDAFEAGDDRWLITSPEYQMKRLVVGGAGDIYQLCRCFRRDELGEHHEPEFTMLEWYRLGEAARVRHDTERLVASCAVAVNDSVRVRVRDRIVDLAPPWPVVTVREALSAVGKDLDAILPNEELFFRTWIDAVEPGLGLEQPVFVTEWPASMASLARLCPHDPTVADRFEVYVHGLELSNGFDELTDPVEQRRRFEADREARRAAGRPVFPIDERFMDALDEGLPRCSGNALGVDRLVMLLTKAESIADVMAIPSRWL